MALQSIIIHSSGASSIKTKKEVILQCAKRLHSTKNEHARATMLHLLTQQVDQFPSLVMETWRRSVKNFVNLDSDLVKC